MTVLKSGGYRVRIAQLPGTYGEARLAERTFGLRPGHGAAFGLFVGSACSDARVRRTSAVIVLHAVDHAIRVPLANCRYGLDLSLEPFQPNNSLPAERPWRFPLSVSVPGHLHARRATTLVYRVRLRNLSARPFRFPPTWCPIVNEWIGSQNGLVFNLNCHPAGTIPPHRSVTFVMHYELSPPLPSGYADPALDAVERDRPGAGRDEDIPHDRPLSRGGPRRTTVLSDGSGR